MSSLGRALLDQLDTDDLAELRRLLGVDTRPEPAPAVGWLDSNAAASHLGLSKHALHRLTAERRIPFSQERPGARCYFKRTDLDAWRENDARGVR